MSGGFGLPVLDIAGGLAKLGRTYSDAYEDSRRQTALSALGEAIQGGDYGNAAKVAFGAGDLQTGIGLLKLDDARQQRKLTADADAEFARSIGGGFGVGGPVNAIAAAGSNIPRPAVPSFLDVGNGPQGDYLTGLFRRESNFKTDAQAPTSSARGLGQFTKGTWNQVAAQNPDLGLTPVGNGQDGRTDPQQMVRATKALTATNEGLLQSSGLPVNDATRYALHFLGAGGGRRLVAGALRNPDAPATAYANPDAVAANRNVFFGRDGAPKSAGEVMSDFARSFGGGGRGAPPASAPQVASADPSFAPSVPSPLSRPLQAAPGLPQQAGGLAPAADLPAPGAQNAEFRIPPGPQFSPPASQVVPGPVAALPQGLSGAGDGRGGGFQPQSAPGVLPQRLPPSSSPETRSFPAGTLAPTLPTGPAPARVMAMPGDAPPAQPPQDGGVQIPPGAMIGNVPAQAYAQGPLGQRIPALMRAVANPNLSDGPRQLAQTMLKQALDETKLPDGVKEFMAARSMGLTQARNLAEFAREKQRDPGQDLTGQIDARAAAAQRYGLQPGTPEFRDYTLGNRPTRDPGQDLQAQIRTREQEGIRLGMQPGSAELQSYALGNRPPAERQTEAEKITGAIEARRQAAAGLGLEPGTPAYRSFVGSGKIGADRDLSAGEKKSIEAADTAALAAQQSIGMLEQAKQISAKAYAGPLASERGKLTSMVGNEAGQATLELDNLVTTNALANLKSIFGGNPTEGERKILLDVAGSSNLPHALRVKVYDRAIQAAELRQRQNEARASQIREGSYFRPGGGQVSAQAGGQSGAPALPPPSPSNRPGAVSAGDRFGQLVGSGMSKAQAYQQLHSEGY